MNDSEIVQQVKALCEAHRYDEAIKLTNDISDSVFAICAHLLCIEHERRYYLDQAKEQTKCQP